MRSCRVLYSDHFTPAIYTEIVALESEADCLQLHRSFTALLEGYSECAGIVLLQREVQLQRAATLYLGDHPKAAIDDHLKTGHRK